jgi:exonuclease III
MFRVVAWNIRAGGGVRIDRIGETITDLAPDVAVLSEFRATPPSVELAKRLARDGLCHQVSTGHEISMATNGLLIATRTPLSNRQLRRRPTEPGRFKAVKVSLPTLTIAGMHIPNQHTGRKPQYHDAVLNLMQGWRGGPALFAGDTNSGRSGIDEQTRVFNQKTTAWFDRIEEAGWRDAFRLVHGSRQEFTWYSPGHDNGFRLDQVFVSPQLVERVENVSHIWAEDDRQAHRRDAVSDHAALVVDLDLSGLG